MCASETDQISARMHVNVYLINIDYIKGGRLNTRYITAGHATGSYLRILHFACIFNTI